MFGSMNTLKTKKNGLGIRIATGAALAATAVGGVLGVAKYNDHNNAVRAHELEQARGQIGQLAKDIGRDIVASNIRADGSLDPVGIIVLEDGTLSLTEWKDAGKKYTRVIDIDVRGTHLYGDIDPDPKDVLEALEEAKDVSITYNNSGDGKETTTPYADNGFRYWTLDSVSGGIKRGILDDASRVMSPAELGERVAFLRDAHNDIQNKD